MLSLVILFIVGVSSKSIANTDYSFGKHAEESGSDTDILLASRNFAPLMGILGGGFYFHNVSIPVIQNAAEPKKSLRDLMIGYFLVFLTYACCGSLGYLGFVGTSFQSDSHADTQPEIEQNCLNMFSTKDEFATFIRLCIFLQLMTINALLFACLRAQVLLLVTRKQKTKSNLSNFLINLTLMTPAFCLTVWYPNVGEVAALCAAFSTMLVMYCLPILTYLRKTHLEAEMEADNSSKGSTSYVFRFVICVLALLYGIQVFILQLM